MITATMSGSTDVIRSKAELHRTHGEKPMLLLKQLTKPKTTDERKEVAEELANTVASSGSNATLLASSIVDGLLVASNDKKNITAREGAMQTVVALANNVGVAVEAHAVLRLLPVTLELLADKAQVVRAAAEEAALALVNTSSKYAVRMILEILFKALEPITKWQTKVGACNGLIALSAHAPQQVCACLPEIVPVFGGVVWDSKPDVRNAAKDALIAACGVVGNMDIDKHVPMLVGCMTNPENVPECMYQLAATTFVTQVEAPTLAIMAPLLERGLSERQTAIKRQAAVIIDNMCKLVENPADIEQFLPKLLPGLEKVVENHADPECRQVAERAVATLRHVGGEAAKAKGGVLATDRKDQVAAVADRAAVLEMLKTAVSGKKAALQNATEFEDAMGGSLEYVAGLANFLIERKNVDEAVWNKEVVAPYLTPFFTNAGAVSELTKAFLKASVEDMKKRAPKEEVEDDEEGEELCNCEFSLAYGGMILLNNTRLRLKRGKRYGLCGANGCGKSTLLRAINNGQLDGFPPADQLKTVFVEHSLQGSESEHSVLSAVVEDADFKDVDPKEVADTLASVGFTADMQKQPVASLSGGWRMKLELARAMLLKADIMLLDEPTNHLDVANVAWLEGYLNSLTNVTSIIVSHDSGFLDNVCTHIIHYEHRKLVTYRGNLAEFVRVKPEAQAYYQLDAAATTFKFPEPGFLEGIKDKGKAVIKMKNISFSYPNTNKLALSGVTLNVSLASRIGVTGPNGAGKSTLIKLLTGETVPTAGEIWKHPALRFAYVAQHAFHHIEQHLDKTANQYVQWRFQGGEDRELLAKESRQLSDEEKAQMAKQVVWDGTKRVVEMIMARRKMKRSYEYEIKWKNLPFEENAWVPGDDLEKWGFKKIVQRFDDREAALQGVYKRTLSAKNIQKHFEDIGLDAEFSTHTRIRGLSGGQKVKVVLGAAMWLQPHIIVMDEPTNFLDRESLGALAKAIKEFGGGVCIISHNKEFVSSVCPEVWTVANGVVTANGVSSAVPEKIEFKQEDTMTDAFGNVTKVKTKKKLSRKELKAREKRRKEAAKEGRELSSDDDYEE